VSLRALSIGLLVGAFLLATGASAAPSADPVGGLDWNANAVAFRGQNGLLVTYKCPAGGTVVAPYGTGTYTDDSRVCSAAVHAGLITPVKGGTVKIKIVPGKPNYLGSTKNGITSSSYGAWAGAFVFYVPPKPTGPVLDGGTGWKATANAWAAKVGSRYRYSCPPNGKLAPVKGTKTYTVDSSVCSAAVHAGEISVTQGGNVIILIQAGKSSYAGTFKNGVTSQASGPAKASFVFTKA
jgi:hypothetical protein